MSDILHAFRRVVLTVGAACLLLSGYFTFQGLRHMIGALEVERWPVLAGVQVCDGRIAPDTGKCQGNVLVFAAFEQTGARCEGRDAIVTGTMSKVRTDAVYVDGRQQIYYGDPAGRFRPTFFEFEDAQEGTPTNRLRGVQDWGPWRLLGGCVTEYTTWFSTVEHRPWHGFWNLPTTIGPFPLPRAKID
ncbi:hypothetical protein [Aureimonas sp. AU40]|uniref:hypothetical protein n=1 Tax=Aureimonas sp. AU40 TaxID=1637747 RepID=UPI000786120A|nr:hypothetical protein [Aureimonas sp. AU40]